VKRTGKAWIPFYYGNDRVRTSNDILKFKNGILSHISHGEGHY